VHAHLARQQDLLDLSGLDALDATRHRSLEVSGAAALATRAFTTGRGRASASPRGAIRRVALEPLHHGLWRLVAVEHHVYR